MSTQLIGVRVESAKRQADDGNSGAARDQLRGGANLIAKWCARKFAFEDILRIEFCCGVNDLALDRENVFQRRVAFIRRDLCEFRVAQELCGIGQCDGAYTLPRQRPHVARTYHHSVCRKTAWCRIGGKTARKPTRIQIFFAIGCRIPYFDRTKVRQVRIRITEPLHHRKLLLFPERHQGLQGRMQPLPLGKLLHLIARNRQLGSQRRVGRISKGNHGIEAVVGPFQFDQYQQVVVWRGAGDWRGPGDTIHCARHCGTGGT